MAKVNMYDCDYTNPPAQDGDQCLIERLTRKKLCSQIICFTFFWFKFAILALSFSHWESTQVFLEKILKIKYRFERDSLKNQGQDLRSSEKSLNYLPPVQIRNPDSKLKINENLADQLEIKPAVGCLERPLTLIKFGLRFDKKKQVDLK